MNCEIGVYGLGAMGAALARNFTVQGFRVAAYSAWAAEREGFRGAGPDNRCELPETLNAFTACLTSPRRILLMLPAGPAIDQAFESLLPLLSPGDVVMDGANSWYADAARRSELAHKHGLYYLGIGLSGGEAGALQGPGVMAGGDLEGWALCADIWNACAAKSEGRAPCSRYIGSGGAGHYAKMVYNSIEYGILQIIAETYLLMDQLFAWSGEEIAERFSAWPNSELSSYLVDAAVILLSKQDDDDSQLTDTLLDVAEKNGAGKWIVTEGIERGIYIPTLIEAQAMRNHSARRELRRQGLSKLSLAPLGLGSLYNRIKETDLQDALYASILICYSQGIELLYAASRQFSWDISLPDVIGCWKAGYIIRTGFLRRIERALPDAYQGNLLLSAEFCPLKEEAALRLVSENARTTGIFTPAFSASLNYYDACRANRVPGNLIQGLRDYFSAHDFGRSGVDDELDAEWDEE